MPRRPRRSPSAARRPSSRALVGQALRAVRRRGKFIILELERDAIVVNAMLTGRFQLAAPGDKHPPSTAVDPRRSGRATRGAGDAARAGRAGASWLPADDAAAEVRYRDPSQMGKVYLLPAGVERAVPGLRADQGPDADDPALTLEVWRARIQRHPGELKTLLRNQAFVAGIGNAYSDEILHAARLQPVPEARRPWRPRRSMRSTRRSARPSRARSMSCASACRRRSRSRSATSSPSTTRRRGVPALRDATQRGQLPERGDDVVPGLPALSWSRPTVAPAGPEVRDYGISRICPMDSWFAFGRLLRSTIAWTVVPNCAAIALSVSPA